nr:MAG TPA: DNA-directed RNA polymerase II subunit [Caudoviricetes sp.]
MTEREAINELHKIRPRGGIIPQKRAEALDVTIQALEKQIPKKPTYEGDGYAPDGTLVYDTWICPCCDKRYEVDYDDYDYCPDCGQKLDWSDED